MSTSVPVCDDEQGLFGLSWPSILRMRDRLARMYFYKYQQRIPREEFLSAGNLAIAIARRDFPSAASGSPFDAYLGRTMIDRFSEMLYQERVKKMRKVTQYGLSLTQYPTAVQYDRWYDAQRLLRYAQTCTTPRTIAMLEAWLAGDSDGQIGHRFGLDQSNVSRAITKTMHTLQAWAWHGEERAPGVQRRTTTLRPHDQQTIARLLKEGTSIGALKRRYGCAREVIQAIDRQGAAV